MKKSLIIALALAPILAFSQTGDGKNSVSPTDSAKPIIVSVRAKATDVRAIIADLFAQAKQNYVLQPGIQSALFLTLDNVGFEQALGIICDQAKLQFLVQNGIYFISKKAVVAPSVPSAPKGTLDKAVLDRSLTAKFTKTDMRLVLAAFGKQTGVDIEVDSAVPRYKLDASLNHATLRFALTKLTEAAGLKYRFTDNLSILVYKPEQPNKIAITHN